MKKILSILEYLLAIYIVLNCRSVFQHITIEDYKIKEILVIILVCLVILNILLKRYDTKKMKKAIQFLIIYYMYTILFILLNDISNIKNYIYNFMIIFPFLYFYYYTSKDTRQTILKILDKIANVVVFLAIVSLILYFLGPILNVINSTGNININWGIEKNIKSYYNLQFAIQKIDIFGKSIIRNTGIFTEAPMYSLNLTIALAIQLFISEKKSFKKQLILIFSIITTFSTTGIIVASILLAIKFLIYKSKRYEINILKYVIFPIFIIILVIVCMFFYKDKSSTNSYSIRMEDYKAAYKAWMDHPIIGNGYDNTDTIEYYMSFSRENTGLSNSIFVLLAECGIYLGVIYFIPFIVTIIYGIKNRKENIIIFSTIIMILFITTIFQFTVMIINLLAIGYSLIGLKEKNKIEYIEDINNEI